MKNRLLFVVGSLLALLLCPSASAQPAPAPATTDSVSPTGPGMMQGNRPLGMRARGDCTQSPDPAACATRRAAHEQAKAACRDQTGAQRRECVQAQMQKVDCSRMRSPEHCAARQAARQACQGEPARTFRQCVRNRMPPVDCSQAAHPQRCAARQAARAACAGQPATQRRSCIAWQLKGR